MKPSKLYIRIFVSFLVLLIVTEIAIFGFFVSFAARKFREYYREYGQIRFDMARGFTEYRISESPIDFTNHTPAFQEFIDHLGVAFKTKIWITDADNTILYHSFNERHPKRQVEQWTDELKKESSYLQRFSRFDIYKSGLITVGNNQPITLHMLFGDRPPLRYVEALGIGLFMIGLIVALVTVPIARKISKPINALTESAKKLEQGELAHRTTVSSKDEIGELATAFNKMASKLEKMVKSGKEMTAQVSHELRSPLARIQIAVEILKDKLMQENDDETTGQLKTIQTDVDELDRIIGRILELSKLDLQNQVPYTEVFSPAKLLADTIDRYETTFHSKKIRIDTKLSFEAKIIGNREAFGTAFANLMDNACKYTPTQGNVRFEALKIDDKIELVLANSGPGLTEEDLQKIFDPFFRITINGENGAGLGLSITRKIIEKHGGRIVGANTASGLEFRIMVPVVRLD